MVRTQMGLLLICVILALAGGVVGGVLATRTAWLSAGQSGLRDAGYLSDAFRLREFRSGRASTWNRNGQNKDFVVIPAGKAQMLLEEKGAGCIRHIYWTYIIKDDARRREMFRALVLRAFWDGAAKPSIEVPLGDFFGISNGEARPIRSLAFTSNPGDTADPASWGLNCYLPMPFARGARVEIENQSEQEKRIWFHVDYELYDDASAVPPDAGRLHALWNRENPTVGVPYQKTDDPRDKPDLKYRWQIPNLTGKENYPILDLEGDGVFAGYFLTVVNLPGDPWTWWGEGDDMIFIDGEGFPPSFHGTGSEEIFGGGCCPAVEYSGPYTGFHCVENWNGQKWLGTNGMYRFHLTDPIRFKKSIRVSIEHGHGNNKANDYSSVAFWYQYGVNEKLPPLAPFEKRGCRVIPLPAKPQR